MKNRWRNCELARNPVPYHTALLQGCCSEGCSLRVFGWSVFPFLADVARILVGYALPTRPKGPVLGFGGFLDSLVFGFPTPWIFTLSGPINYHSLDMHMWLLPYLFLFAGCMNICHPTLRRWRSLSHMLAKSIVRIVRCNFGICRRLSMSCEL